MGNFNFTPTYSSWAMMLDRCRNTNNKRYHRYGGRGIKVCERWLAFDNFLADMGERPSTELTLDRIDNDGNYEPSNCRWANRKQQANNRSSNHLISAFGETLTLAQWCEKTGLSHPTIHNRLKRGWPPEKALNRPSIGQGRTFADDVVRSIMSEKHKLSQRVAAKKHGVSKSYVAILWNNGLKICHESQITKSLVGYSRPLG